MFSSTMRRSAWAVPAALVLSLLMAGQAAAVTWSAPKPLAMAVDVSFIDIATAGGNAVAVYGVTDEETGQVIVRRSTDSGNSWQQPQLLASNGILPVIAGRDSSFDVVWNNDTSGRVRYARSTNGGATFGPSVALSPSGRFAWRPAVARGPNGVVAVVWEDVANGAVQVRVSTNGGSSFGSISTLSTLGQEMGVGVAVGQGVIYVAYSVGEQSFRIKRSFDNGTNWSTPAVVTDQAFDSGLSLTAQGSRAFIAFTGPGVGSQFSRVRIRGTADKGANWSPAVAFAPADWTTHEPDVSLQGGVLRAVFARCSLDFDICFNDRVYYRQRVIGSSWSAPERATPTTVAEARGAHVAYTGTKILVAYSGDFTPYVRAGTP